MSMTQEQLKEFNFLLSLATEEASTPTLRRLLQILKTEKPTDNGGLEELGYVIAGRLLERGEYDY